MLSRHQCWFSRNAWLKPIEKKKVVRPTGFEPVTH